MYRKSSQGWLKHFDFILLDIICLQVAFILSYVFRFGTLNPYKVVLYRNFAIVILFISLSSIIFIETFKDVLKRDAWQELVATLKQSVMVLVISTFYLFAVKEGEDYSRAVTFLTCILYFVISYIVRLAWKSFFTNRRSTRGKRSLLIITQESMIENCLSNILEANYQGFRIAGMVIMDKDLKGKRYDNYIDVVANKMELIDYLSSEWIDEVLINVKDDSLIPKRLVEKICGMGIVLHTCIARERDRYGRKQFVETVGKYTVLTTSINYASTGKLVIKRIIDIIGGIVGCAITGVLFLIIAPVIMIQSPGPVFFSQVRVGKNGKKFKIYKFRTMYLDAEERKKELMEQNRIKDGLMFKIDFDPRIIGNKVLPDGTQKSGFMDMCRRMSIDEFPQFFNVLKGDMSLVGTRPPTEQEVQLYSPHHHARLAAKPGITGMWQVSGRSNITDFEEVVRLDRKYISEWSLRLDFIILFKTIAVVFKREGSM